MTITSRYSVPLSAVIGVCFALILVPTASAQPTCVNTAPNTTMCTTNGSSSITTSPPEMNNGPFYGWPFGGGFFMGIW
jgi:hypothetical protein